MSSDMRSSSPTTVVTPIMQEAQDRIQGVHARQPGFIILAGSTGVGKTTTALYIVDTANETARTEAPGSYCAFYFEASGDSPNRRMKHGIYRVYAHVLRELSAFEFRNKLPELLAEELLHGLQMQRLQLLIIDEAWTLSSEEIRGLAHVLDLARLRGWPLSIVLIGMENLRQKIRAQAQVDSRVMLWVHFDVWTLANMRKLLESLHPAFVAAVGDEDEKAEMVQFVHEFCRRKPRRALAFVSQMDWRLKQVEVTVCNLAFLKFVAADMERGEQADPEAA